MEKLEQRWARRRAEATAEATTVDENVSHSDSVWIAAPPSLVWAFIRDLAAVALTHDDVICVLQMPGPTQDEIGSRVCGVFRQPDGTILGSVSELVDIEPARREVWRERSVHHPVTSTAALTDDRGGCELRLTFQATAPRQLADIYLRDWPAWTNKYLSRVKAYIEAAEHQRS